MKSKNRNSTNTHHRSGSNINVYYLPKPLKTKAPKASRYDIVINTVLPKEVFVKSIVGGHSV